MQKTIETLGFSIVWFAVIMQFILSIQNTEVSLPETIIRFFSYFTILTNLLVALFFTFRVFGLSIKPFTLFNKKGALTSLTTFILIVGLVYQVALRGIWEPIGMQLVVDELLHTIIPLYVLVYWLFFSGKEKISFRNVVIWLLYPVVYLLFILVRGHFSNFYPYPFLNINDIGIEKTLLNIMLIIVLMLFILSILVGLKNKRATHKTI